MPEKRDFYPQVMQRYIGLRCPAIARIYRHPAKSGIRRENFQRSRFRRLPDRNDRRLYQTGPISSILKRSSPRSSKASRSYPTTMNPTTPSWPRFVTFSSATSATSPNISAQKKSFSLPYGYKLMQQARQVPSGFSTFIVCPAATTQHRPLPSSPNHHDTEAIER